MLNPFLVGEAVYLRPLEKADAAMILPWVNDPEITQNLLLFQPINFDQEAEFIGTANRDPHSLTLGIAVRANDHLIGATGLKNIDFRSRHAGFGIMIGVKEHWGKGLGTEATRLIIRHAFETLNLNRVWLHVYEYNPRAIRVYEKVGFRQEGVLRQDRFHQGKYWDTSVMAILRSEWEAKNG